MVSHTFIRSEIRALEERGFRISRVSVRDTRALASDDQDRAEAERTAVLLDRSPAGVALLVRATVRRALEDPKSLLNAAKLALQMGFRTKRGAAVHLIYLVEAARLVEMLKAQGVEHVHAHFGTNSATVAMLAEELGGPSFSFTAHGPEEFDRPEDISLADKIARARFVAGVSSFGRSQLLRRTCAASWHKVKVVPCGVDDAFLGEAHLRPIPIARRLVCVGRLCEQKGQLLLLEAAAVLAREGEDFELVLVGDGPLRSACEERVRHHGLARIVRITGWADGARVRDELNAARALVLPSFAEGLPVVIMESLALRRPVISTYVAGIPELVEPGRSGWLVPAGDVPQLVSAMRAALHAAPEALERLGDEGRRRVLERHDARKAAAILADAFG